jgi:hypothetical protein
MVYNATELEGNDGADVTLVFSALNVIVYEVLAVNPLITYDVGVPAPLPTLGI